MQRKIRDARNIIERLETAAAAASGLKHLAGTRKKYGNTRKRYDIGPFRPDDFKICSAADAGKHLSAGIYPGGHSGGGPGSGG